MSMGNGRKRRMGNGRKRRMENGRRRYSSRFYNFFIPCCHRGLSTDDDDKDMYESPKARMENRENDKTTLLQKLGNYDVCGISDTDDTLSSATVYSNNSETNSCISCTSLEKIPTTNQEASPKRPCSFTEELPSPNSQTTREDEILQRLAEQTGKLNQILTKLHDDEQHASLRKHVDVLYSHLRPWQAPWLSQCTMTDTAQSSRRESRCFTFGIISETREPHEHDDISGQQHVHSCTEQSPKAFEASEMSETTIKDPIGPSLPREPKEHDCSIMQERQTSELTEIISDQVKELQKYSRENMEEQVNGLNEVQNLVTQMREQVDRLANLPVLRRYNAEALRRRSFVRCSYPSPIGQGKPGATEIIEMQEINTSDKAKQRS